MKIFIEIDEDNFVTAFATSSFSADSFEVDVDGIEDISINHLSYKYEDGVLTFIPEKQAEIAEELEALKNVPTPEEKIDELKSVSSALLGGEQSDNEQLVAMTLNKALQKFASSLPEEEALELAAMYPKWENNKRYAPGQYVRYGLNQDGEPQVFSVLQEHTSQSDWLPPQAAALYKKLGFTEDGTPTWVQPLGATDAYQAGDKVSHNGKIYVSTADNNVWEPGVYGWQLDGGNTQAQAKGRR